MPYAIEVKNTVKQRNWHCLSVTAILPDRLLIDAPAHADQYAPDNQMNPDQIGKRRLTSYRRIVFTRDSAVNANKPDTALI